MIGKSAWAARSRAAVKLGSTTTSGILPRPDCSAADAAIFCQRSNFFFKLFSSGFDTHLPEGNVTISYAPNSVAFWITCSSLSDLGKAMYTLTFTAASAADRRRSRTSNEYTLADVSFTLQRHSLPAPSHTSTCSPIFSRNTFAWVAFSSVK